VIASPHAAVRFVLYLALCCASLGLGSCGPEPPPVVAPPPSATTPPPPAEKVVLHVLAIQTSDADDQAEGLTNALRATLRTHPRFVLAPGDYSLEVLSVSLGCSEPPDAACESKLAAEIKADRFLWGVLSKGKNGKVAGELHFWSKDDGKAAWKVDYSANLTEWQDEALRKIAEEAIAKLTTGVKPPAKPKPAPSGSASVVPAPVASVSAKGK